MTPEDDKHLTELARLLPTTDGTPLKPVLAALLAEVDNGVVVTDAELDEPGPRILYVNPRFESITGYSADEVVGRSPRFLQGPLTDRAVLDRLRADLEAGRPFEGETRNYRKDGTPFDLSWRITPITDRAGRITHFIAVQEDRTAMRQAQADHLELLEQVQHDAQWLEDLVALSVRLVTTTRPSNVWSEVVDCAVDRLDAVLAAVVTIDPATGATNVEARRGPRGRSEVGEPAPHTLAAVADALSEDHPLFLDDLDDLAAQYPELGAAFRGAGLRAAAILPVRSRTVRGGLILGWTTSRRFHVTERQHLGILAILASEGFAQTASLDSHRSLAMQLQTALLPTVSDVEHLEVCWRYHPAGDQALVGGDWYDIVHLPGDRVAIFVGDVVGHGNEAAALMGEIRFTIRGLLRGIQDPAAVLDELDRCLHENHPPSEALATLCALVLSRDGTLEYATAGHPQPLIRRADGRVAPVDGPGGRMIGLDPAGEPRTSSTTVLRPGETLLAFSDGLFERRGEDYDTSYEQLRDLVEQGPSDLVDLCDAAVSRAGTDGARRDDVVIVAVRRRDHP